MASQGRKSPLLLLFLLTWQLLPCGAEGDRQPLVEHGVQVCTGIVEAFLHKGNVTKEEVNCVASALGDVAVGAFEAADSVASLFDELLDDDAKRPVPMVLLKLAESMHGLLHVLDSVLDSCVNGGRAAQLLSKAAMHFGNLTYVFGHLAANGEDILEEASDAIKAFNAADFHRFGRDIGTATRKVLLAKATSDVLPEGQPDVGQLVNVSAGLLQGFFGEGFELDISSDQRIVTRPRSHIMEFILDGVSTSDEAEDLPEQHVLMGEERVKNIVRIDLHQCVSKNLDFFRAVMSKTWFFFARATAVPSKPHFRKFLASTLQGLPRAMERCGLHHDQQDLLLDAVQSVGHVQLQLKLPEEAGDATEAAQELERAAHDWSSLSWFALGTDMGRMLQSLVVQSHPGGYKRSSTKDLAWAWKAAESTVAEAHEALAEQGGVKPSRAELASGGFKSAEDLGADSGLSVSGVDIVVGFAEGLLHKEKLSREEADCLMESVGNVLGGASEMAENLIAVADEMAEGDAPPEQLYDPDQIVDVMTRSIDGVSRLAEGFMATCESKSAEAFQVALEHLSDFQYVTDRLVVNGHDVNAGIDTAVEKFKSGDVHQFGREIGTIVRKVSLSSKTAKRMDIPEVTMGDIVNVSTGMLAGFFGKGFALDATSDKKLEHELTLPEILAGKSEEPPPERLDLHIDLHQCVQGNLVEFQRLMAQLLRFFMGTDAMNNFADVNLEGLLVVLMQLGTVMKRCGLDEEKAGLLMESVESLDHLHVAVELPEKRRTGPNEALALLKQCIVDWSDLKFLALGEDLGRLLRKALLNALPKEGSTVKVDENLLKALKLNEQHRQPIYRTGRTSLTLSSPLLWAGALVGAATMGLRAVSTAWRRARSSPSEEELLTISEARFARRGMEDLEDGAE